MLAVDNGAVEVVCESDLAGEGVGLTTEQSIVCESDLAGEEVGLIGGKAHVPGFSGGAWDISASVDRLRGLLQPVPILACSKRSTLGYFPFGVVDNMKFGFNNYSANVICWTPLCLVARASLHRLHEVYHLGGRWARLVN